MSATAKMQLEQGSWTETFHEIYIGFVVGVMHNWYFIDKFLREKIAMPVAMLLGFDDAFVTKKEEKEKTPPSGQIKSQ